MMFNMEVNQMQLLEIGLNALGFLAAGGIMMVLSSMFRRQSRKGRLVEATTTQPVSGRPTETGRTDQGFQFIDLSGDRGDLTPPVKPVTETALSRRNRVEVYELAQQMLRARKPVQEISDELSMSQAEVNLLKAISLKDKGVQHA